MHLNDHQGSSSLFCRRGATTAHQSSICIGPLVSARTCRPMLLYRLNMSCGFSHQMDGVGIHLEIGSDLNKSLHCSLLSSSNCKTTLRLIFVVCINMSEIWIEGLISLKLLNCENKKERVQYALRVLSNLAALNFTVMRIGALC